MHSRTFNTCSSLQCSVIEFLDHCYLETLNRLIVLCYICHMYPHWHTLRMSCCSAVVCHCFVTPKVVNRHFPTPTGPLSANRTPPALWQTNLDVFWLIHGMPVQSHELEDGTVGLQLSSKHILTSQWWHNYHAGYSSPAHTQGSPLLCGAHQVLSLLCTPRFGKCGSLWCMNCTRVTAMPFLSQLQVLHSFGMLTLCWHIFSHALINRWFK